MDESVAAPVGSTTRTGAGVVAVSSVVTFGLCVAAVLTTVGQSVDNWVFEWLLAATTGSRYWLPHLARVVLPHVLPLVAVALALLALVMGRWRAALAGIATGLSALPLAFWVRDGIALTTGLEGLPSGHVVGATSLILASLILWPPVRGRAHLVGVAVLLVASLLGNITGHAHRPVDAVAGLLLSLGVAASWLWLFNPSGDSR